MKYAFRPDKSLMEQDGLAVKSASLNESNKWRLAGS